MKKMIVLAALAACGLGAVQAQESPWMVRFRATNLDMANKTTATVATLGVNVNDKTIPVVPGIMPITSSSQLLRFSDACGAEIPRWVRLRLQAFGDDIASIKAFGLDVVADLCQRLVAGGAPSLHFHTMNQSAATAALVSRLGVA